MYESIEISLHSRREHHQQGPADLKSWEAGQESRKMLYSLETQLLGTLD